jgi:hypothetical protein
LPSADVLLPDGGEPVCIQDCYQGQFSSRDDLAGSAEARNGIIERVSSRYSNV